MNISKLGPVVLSSLAALSSACSVDSTSQKPAQREREPVAERAAESAPAPLPVTQDEVIVPRQGRTIDPAEYVATEGPYRLFGIEPGEGRASAIIADVRTWSTRRYHEGDAIGRGMRVAKIEPSRVILHDAQRELVLEPGVNVHLRLVRHRLDVVARPLGRHRYALDTAAARAAWDSGHLLPSYEAAELYDGPVLKLGPVTPGTLLAEADFREGDLVAAVDGTPAGPTTLDEIARGLTDGRPSITVLVYRGGVPLERSFTTSPR